MITDSWTRFPIFCRSSKRLWAVLLLLLIKSNSLSLQEQKASQGARGRVSPMSEENLLRSHKPDQISIISSAWDQIEAIEGLEDPGPLSGNWCLPNISLSHLCILIGQKIWTMSGCSMSGMLNVWVLNVAMPLCQGPHRLSLTGFNVSV